MSNVDTVTISAALSEYCFAHIWNEPASESRVNVKPYLVNNSRSCTGYCLAGLANIKLPTRTDAFFVYRFTEGNVFNRLKLTSNWINSAELCNKTGSLIHIYTKDGKMLPKSSCYLMNDPSNNSIILTITKKALNTIGATDREIYLTTYHDSDIENDITVVSAQSNINDILHTVRYLLQNNKGHQVTAFINGVNYRPEYVVNNYQPGQYLDIIIDENIIGEFTVNVTEDPHTFHSSQDNLFKEIIHIPKALNPNNAVITHNTCTMYVRRPDGAGSYLHFTSNKTVGQITHNDLSIPTYILDAHKDYLDSSIITVDVKISIHDKDNELLRNSNFIDLLYITQSDDEIIQHLEGKLSDELDFWLASELEKHPYIKMMFDTPNIVNEDNIHEYVDTLGYYKVAALLCQRVFTARVTDFTGKVLTYPKPYIWRNMDIYPVVSINGRKVNSDYVKYQNNANGTITIGLTSGISANTNDTMTIYLFPRGRSESYVFTPTYDEPSYTFATGEFTLYKEINHGSIEIKGMYKESNLSYAVQPIEEGKITVSDNTTDGTTTITFSSDFYDTRFLISYNNFTQLFKKDITNDIANNDNFVITLEDYAVGSDELFPLLNTKDLAVYFNGRYLVKGIDYELVKVDAYDGSVAMVQVIVQNMSYGIDDGPNIIEVVASSVEISNVDNGYVINDIASKDIDIDLWFKGLSTLHVDGYYEYDVTTTGVGLILPNGKYSDGKVFELKTAIPKSITDLLLPNTGESDREKINKIESYLNANYIEPDSDVIITDSHRLVSSFMNYLIKGILNDEITITYDPDTDRMTHQLDQYNHLRQFDVIFREEDPINLRFIDIYPTYSELTIDDPAKAKVIYLLSELLIPTDNNTSGVVTNVRP